MYRLLHPLTSIPFPLPHSLPPALPPSLPPSFPPQGETKGIGIIKLSSEEEAKKAVAALNGQKILGRWVAVREGGWEGGWEGGREEGGEAGSMRRVGKIFWREGEKGMVPR